MPSSLSFSKNYSKCPLKKRPVHFTFEESAFVEQPENLSFKNECAIENNSSDDEEIEVGGSPVPMNNIKSAVVIPTPTYPKLHLQPWGFHIPYTTGFYRQQQNANLLSQVSPLRSDLHSPNTPSSEGSLSPPPHYLNGRPSSISPPIRGDIYRTVRIDNKSAKYNSQHIIKSGVIGQNRQHPYRYIPNQIPAVYQPYMMDIESRRPINQQPPVSPSYSDASSYYSHRSISPESPISPAPVDLSLKHSPKPSHNLHQELHSTTYVPVGENTASNNPPRYQCPDCQKSYSTFSGLTKHQQFHCQAAEGNQAKKSFSCKDCDKTYVSLGALKMHIRTHTLPCKCTICGKAFSRPWLLQGHIRTHTGEKPFSCQHCHRAFADRSNLRAHLQTHSDIKKYSCDACSKTFSRMSLLTKHSEGGCSNVQGNSHNTFIPPYTEIAEF